jgi:hypothetical protein
LSPLRIPRHLPEIDLVWLGIILVWAFTIFTPAKLESSSGPVTVLKKAIHTKVLDLEFPQLQGLPDRNIEKILNQRLRKEIDSFAAKYRQQTGVTADAQYTVKRNRHGLLSILFNMVVYHEGAAHPLPMETALTMNLNTGKIYQLADLFKPKSPWRKLVNASINRQIAQRGAQGDLTLLTPFPGVKNNQDFYIEDDNLVVFFQVYEYTPYVDGFPEFHMPLKRLKDILNPEISP